MFLPAMSGAEPCTGSNSEGNLRSGFRLPDGARPIVPVQAGPRSDRMSPNRLVATTTSKRSGLSTKRAQRMSMCCLSHVTSGYCAKGWPAGDLVPPRHADRDAVAFGGHGLILLALAPLREIERELQHALAAVPREDISAATRIRAPCLRTSRPPTDEYSPSVFSPPPRSRYRPACDWRAAKARRQTAAPGAD